MKTAILFILTIICAQAQDTTGNYSIARSKVDKLIRIALKAKECDTLVHEQEKLIQDDIRSQAKADSVIKAERERGKTLEQHILQCDTLSTDRLQLLGIEHRQKKKWKGIAIFMGIAEAVKIALTGKL